MWENHVEVVQTRYEDSYFSSFLLSHIRAQLVEMVHMTDLFSVCGGGSVD